MKINGRCKRRRALPEYGLLLRIEIFPIRLAVNHGALKPKIAHAALQFVCRCGRIMHRKVGEAAVPAGTLLNFFGKKSLTPFAFFRATAASFST